MLGTAAHILGCTANLRDAEELREQLQAALCSVLESPADRPELRATCDRVIRACIQRLGSSSGEAHQGHLASLLRLAELASDGHRCSTGGIGGGSPLYLERLLFHLLRSACSCGLGPSCGPLSEKLLSGLSACPGREEEVAGVGRSAFALLWGAASSLTPGPGLSLRLRALPFLAREPPPSPLLQRFIQACRLYLTEEGGEGGESRGSHLVLETQDLLGVLLKDPRPPSPGGNQLRFLLSCQLALQAAAALSRSGCPSEARGLMSWARSLLRQSGEAEGGPFLTALRLSLLSPGLRGPQSSLALARALGALRSLGAGVGSLGRQALADGCRFLLAGVRLAAGGGGGEKAPPLQTEELLQLAGFLHVYLEQELPSLSDAASLRLCYQNLEFFTRAVYDFLLEPQDEGADSAVKLLVPCKEIVKKMVELEEDLVAQGHTDYIGATALRLYNLAYGFYCRKLFSEAVQVAVVFRGHAQPPDLFARSSLPPDRVPRFFKLLVQCYRKLGSLASAMETVAMWLMALDDRKGEGLTEPMALWACIKADAAKSGAEELQLRTLKDALQPWELEPGSLSVLLLEELRAYKGLQGDTSRERFNVICDLLQLCSPEGRGNDGEGVPRAQQLRAVQLLELAQILCYRDMSQYTECSPMDCVEESLTVLGSLPETAENRDRLLDDKAHAHLWRYVCDLEARVRESVERSRRIGPVPEGVSELEDGEPNDLDYEERQHGAMSVHDCIDFNLSAESKRCESLDEALSLWKCLLSESPSPALRSAEQTAHAVHLMAALYRLMDKPFQVIESYGLMLRLLDPGTDSLPLANVLLQLGETLLSVDCLEEVQTCLARAEVLLKEGNSGKGDHHLLAKMTCALLRSQLLWATSQVSEGLTPLLEVLTCPSLHKSSKAWYLLKAKVQQLVAAYLSLPPSALPASLRRHLQQHGWRSPESALTDAHKMLCGIIMLVCPGVLSFGKRSSELSCPVNPAGDHLFQKWLVLSNLLLCSGRLVSLLAAVGSAQEAKMFCLETLRLTARLHCVRPCAQFLVTSAELESLRGDPQARDLDLRLVLHLLEPSADFLQERQSRKRTRIRPRKARAPGPAPEVGEVDVEGEGGSSPRTQGRSALPSPLRGRPLSQVETASLGRCASGFSASPPLGSRSGVPSLLPPALRHPDGCPCPVCGDPVLTACCLRWALLLSRGGQPGDVPRVVVSRCRERGAAFSLSLRGLARWALGENGPEAHQCPLPGLPSGPEAHQGPLPGLLSWLEAQAYAQEAWLPPAGEGDGRAWFASRPPGPWPLEHCRASALLASASRDWGDLSVHPGRGGGGAPSPRAPRPRAVREPGPALGKVGTAAPVRRGPRTRLRKHFDDSDPELAGDAEGEVPAAKGMVGPPPTTTSGRVRGKARGSRAERGQRRHRETKGKKDRPETEAVDMQAMYSCLSEACSAIRHCPPSALYPRLCQLMALCLPRHDAYTVAFLLSESVAVTARHQMMQNLHRKSQKMRKERSQDVTEGLRGLSLGDDTPDPEPRTWYLSELGSLFEFSLSDPAHWPQDDVQNFKEQLCMIPDDVTVCLLTLTSLNLRGDQTEILLLTRLRKGRVPVTVRIPVRLSSLLSEFDAILAEQRDISNVTELKAWWDGRTALDRRMQGLVESMERDALGCWKGLLLPGPRDERLDSEAASICALLACPRDCSGVDEELVKAVLGASHLLSDSDMRRIAGELCATDPRKVLLRLEAAVERLKPPAAGQSPQLVLILDKHLQRLPWESMPSLRALRVSRLPSFHFLLGYVVTKKHRVRSVLAEGVNPSSVYYVLNPQGNLPNTERTFKDWFRRRPGWEGVVGRGPSEEKLRSVLCNRDLYLYAGHGAGVRFLEGQEVQKLSCRAASLLLGCSSAALVLRGDLEGVGIVLKYMMAGCPLFLGNLWDVTDKDIDRYMENLLRGWLDAGSEASLLEYVAHARTAPKLKYLIGASPVVYGLSISLQ